VGHLRRRANLPRQPLPHKEPVERLLTLCFGNQLLEPVWDSRHIASVELTLAEELGTGQRPGFYDGIGAIRDVLQHHALQIVTLLAMERPADRTPEAFHEAQTALLLRVQALRPRGRGPRPVRRLPDHPGVAHGSATEAFAATELRIDTPRWAGIPFRGRVGKRVAVAGSHAQFPLRQSESGRRTGNG
jgi:glucose-6-phosphate 1-dehydrogenase